MLVYSTFILVFYIDYDIILICLTGDCFIYMFKLWESFKSHEIAPYLRLLADFYIPIKPGRVAQSVTCLATDTKLTSDPGFVSSIPAQSHTFVEIDHEIISTVILLPSAE